MVDQVVNVLETDAERRQRLEVEHWQVICDAAIERVQNAVDAGAPAQRITKLAFEARGAQMDVDNVRRFGRPLNRRERRAMGLESERVPNGYRPAAR